MAYFNDPQNITNIIDLLKYVDSTTNVDGAGNMLGIILLITISTVSFLTTKAFFSLDRAMLSTMFLAFIVAIFLFVMELISAFILVIVIILFVISLFLVTKAEDSTV